MTAEEFLAEVYRLDAAADYLRPGHADGGATDFIFDRIDRLLCDGSYDAVDAILAATDAARISTFVMRSLLCITAAARHHLPSRAALYARIWPRMVELRGAEKAKRILGGLA